MNLTNKRVLVTGSRGFLGKYVVKALEARGANAIDTPRSKDYDLRDRLHICLMLKEFKPDIVIHLAARVGGIGANMKTPATFFYDNAIMGIEMMEQSRVHGVEKYVQVGTTCSYPKYTPVPFKESDLWSGYPEETNAAYGIAKRALITQAAAYRYQYGFNAITVIPTNLYGPGDNFDLETSHIIPAIIRKMVENSSGVIDVWGTGEATRDFLYVADAAEGIVKATEKYDDESPVNLGSGEEISITSIVFKLRWMTGFLGAFHWDTSKPDGQPRRVLDISRAQSFGWEPTTSLDEGLKNTVKWFRDNQ